MLSFFRKLSIGEKIKDGILPDRIMGTAEDLLKAKNQSILLLKTDTELRESVYGKHYSIYYLIILWENCEFVYPSLKVNMFTAESFEKNSKNDFRSNVCNVFIIYVQIY